METKKEDPEDCEECLQSWDKVRRFDQVMARKYGVHVHDRERIGTGPPAFHECKEHGLQPVLFEECCECVFSRFVKEGPCDEYRRSIAAERLRRAAQFSSERVEVGPEAEELMAFLCFGRAMDEQASYMHNELRASIAITDTALEQRRIPALMSPGQFFAVLEWMVRDHGALETEDRNLHTAAHLLLIPSVLREPARDSLHPAPPLPQLACGKNALADVYGIVSRLPTESLRQQLLNTIGSGDDSTESAEVRIEVPQGASAPISPIPKGWINPHSFEWLWDMKPGTFNHSPDAAKEFESFFAPVPGVSTNDGTTARLPMRQPRHDRLFVLPASSVQNLDTLGSLQELTRSGLVRPSQKEDEPIFVSHRWDGPGHPDPSGMQLKCLKSLAAWLSAIGHRNVVFWYDYCSLPQPPRTSAEDQDLQSSLERIPELLDCYTIFRCPGARTLHSHAARGWCMLETALASQTVIPSDDSVGAMLRLWLCATPAQLRPALVELWEGIWASDLAGIGGFENARILAWIGLSPYRGDPMQANGTFARQVLSDLVETQIPEEISRFVMQCSVPEDRQMVLDLWESANRQASRK